MEGVLEKQGGLLGSVWQERWFKLDVESKRLDYFESNNGLKKGQFLLDGAWVKAEPDGVVFTISGPQMKTTYSLRTRTTEERSQWLQAIMGAAYEVKGAASSSSAVGAQGRTPPNGSSRQSKKTHHGLLLQRSIEIPRLCSDDTGGVIPSQLLTPTHEEWTRLDTPTRQDCDDLVWSPSWVVMGSKDSILIKQQEEAARASGADISLTMIKMSNATTVQSDSESSAGGPGAVSPTSSLASSGTPISQGHCGVMKKRGGVLSLGWEERWFRLDPHSKCLYYYTVEGGAEKGCIQLEGASIEPDDDGMTFAVQHAEHTCVLQCSSADQRATWMRAIRSAARFRGFDRSLGQSSPISVGTDPPDWPDAPAPHCSWQCWRCGTEFTTIVRSHQCRSCQRAFCNRCSTQRHVLRHMGPSEHHRVCISCHHALLVVEAEELHRTKLLVHQIDKFDELWHLKCWKEEVLQHRVFLAASLSSPLELAVTN
uniref:FYVE-type domain-containing protein n=1 Tax=Eutreptiella gymnastica TaxID=73025 RepID=A0A7S4FXT2_9EUGL